MSYPHRVTVAASIREPVRGRQHSQRTIVLDPVVESRERLHERLLGELRRRGFEEQADGAMERRRGDAVERVDPGTMEATSTVERDAVIEKKRETSVGVPRRRTSKAEMRSLRAQAERTLREEGTREFERELAGRVETAGAEMERELNEAIARIYADAVREKAATLGEVGSVREQRSGTELLLEIKVKVSD